MTAKILVTGGAGFIGSEIVKQLSAHDEYEIRVLDALTKQIHGNNPEKSYLFQSIKDCCDFIRGDVRDFTTVQKALEGVDVVLHLAAETGTSSSLIMLFSESRALMKFGLRRSHHVWTRPHSRQILQMV